MRGVWREFWGSLDRADKVIYILGVTVGLVVGHLLARLITSRW